MTFDLENARAADEVLPYPLDAKEIWVSGKGQMHINPPNAPSIFFTLSDLCEFRNIFHGQAAEIERLRAALDESEQILAHKTKTATHWYDEHLQARADRVQTRRVVEQQAARLKELESLIESSMSLVGCHQRVIEKREKALVEERARGNHYGMSYEEATDGNFERWIIDGEKDLPKFYLDRVRTEARRQLLAEGKIGPDVKPHCWQITEERKAAIKELSELLTAIGCPSCHYYIQKNYGENITVLRAMLEEADHDKP